MKKKEIIFTFCLIWKSANKILYGCEAHLKRFKQEIKDVGEDK